MEMQLMSKGKSEGHTYKTDKYNHYPFEEDCDCVDRCSKCGKRKKRRWDDPWRPIGPIWY